MRKGTMSRDQAIEAVGIKAVEAVENENCDFTNRVQTDGDTGVEFSACASIEHNDYNHIIAYYYIEQDDLDAAESLDDLSWSIEGYELS